MGRNTNNSDAKGKVIAIIAAIVIAVIALVVVFCDFLTDLLWFDEVGYTSVFLTEIFTKIKIGIPGFLILTLISYIAFNAFKNSFLKKNNFIIPKESKKKVRAAILGVAIALGLFDALLLVGNLWFEILQYTNSTDFDITDPVFGNDIGFYMFKYDFLSGIADSAIAIVIAFFAALVLLYTLLLGFATKEVSQEEDVELKRPQRESLKEKIHAILDVAGSWATVLGVLFFIFIAFKVYLLQFGILYDESGLFYGAGFTESNIMLNVYRIVMVLSIVSAIMLVVGIKKRSFKLSVIVPIAMVVVFLLGGVLKTVVQSVVVDPDELSKERTYMQRNIEYTQLAYDLNDVKVEEYVPENDLTKEDVLDNMETFSNIRINDFEPAQLFYKSTQSIRSYYTFNDVDVDRYWVNGEYTQVFLSARELDIQQTDDSWLIQHLKYTHGYGLTLSRVDRITSSGQPDMLIQSIPPVSEVEEIQITQPEIYYGELSEGYVITNTKEQEFDYPSGESNVYCEYDGTGGIKLNLLNRILFSIKEQSLKLLISTNITSDSKILIYRGIAERIEKIAPFLTYDDDPYVVTVDGKIYWIADGYTTSNKYPYSEPYSSYSDVNYIRNSVKIVVDAYNGDVSFYICDEEDPIAETLSKIYPDLFKSLDEMPKELREHLQYPNALFEIQAEVYQRYHMSDVDVFYQNEDRWDISMELYGQSEKQMTPNYSIMELPGEDSAEFVSSITFSPAGKKNLSAIFISRQDGEHYGELILYRMPKDRQIYGTAQIEAQVNQDAEISKEFALWNNSGSTYSRGNMFVIPVEGSILYVEPVYLYASTSSLPEVKRVICFYNDKLSYQATLADCLDDLFGDGAGDPLLEPYPVIAGHQAAEELRNQKEEEISQEPTEEPAEDVSSTDDNEELKKEIEEVLRQLEELLQKL